MSEPFDQVALYQNIIIKCWGDESFKTSSSTDTSAPLVAEGYNVPDWQMISVVESCEEDEHIFYIALENVNYITLKFCD
jgi:hypothetical protein